MFQISKRELQLSAERERRRDKADRVFELVLRALLCRKHAMVSVVAFAGSNLHEHANGPCKRRASRAA